MPAATLTVLPTVKQADDMNDSTFESSLSTLARNVLQDKSPRLFEYEIGFQLLEKSDDGDRAVGVFGFQVGPETLYAPVVFDNGAVKGTELLYVKSFDQFVPLTEGWVDAFMRKKPNILGSAASRQDSREGVGYPDLMPLIRSPFKMAARIAAAMDGIDLVKAAHRDPRFNARLQWVIDTCPAYKRAFNGFYPGATLPPVQQPAPASPLMAAQPVAAAPPAAANPVSGPAPSGYRMLPSLAQNIKPPAPAGASPLLQQSNNQDKNQAAALAKTATVDNGTVEVTTARGDAGRLFDVDLSTIQKVLANDYQASDTRKETSMVVPVAYPTAVCNPSRSGRYQVLTPEGEFRDLLVLMTETRDKPRTKCVVLDVTDGGAVKAYGTARPEELWVQPQKVTGAIGDSVLSIANAVDGFPKPRKLSPNWSGKYLLVGQNGESFGPFRVTGDLTEPDGLTTMEVDQCYCRSIGSSGTSVALQSRYGEENDPLWYTPPTNEYWGYGVRGERLPSGRTGSPDRNVLVLTEKPGLRLHFDRDFVYVPDTFRLLTLEEPQARDDMSKSDAYDGNDSLVVGRPDDLIDSVIGKTAELVVDRRFGRYAVGDARDLGSGEAVKELMVGWDLREADALDLLKQAELRPVRVRVLPSERVWLEAVKLADGEPGRLPSTGIDSAAGAPDFHDPPGFSVQTLSGSVPGNTTYETYTPVDPSMLDSGRQRRDMYAPPEGQMLSQAVNQAAQAAQSGQKEVFDVGSFGSLVKPQTDETLIDDHLPALMKAMDAFGTMLFNLYYHREPFEERYGKSDLNELEGVLRSAFKSTGESLLFAKQKSVRSFPGDYGVDFSGKSPV